MRMFLGVTSIVLLVLVIALGVALAFLVTTRQPYVEPFRPDAPPFAQRGDYTVGVRNFTITGENRQLSYRTGAN